jgi:hypothetical protein
MANAARRVGRKRVTVAQILIKFSTFTDMSTLADGTRSNTESSQEGLAERPFRLVADGRCYLAHRILGFREATPRQIESQSAKVDHRRQSGRAAKGSHQRHPRRNRRRRHVVQRPILRGRLQHGNHRPGRRPILKKGEHASSLRDLLQVEPDHHHKERAGQIRGNQIRTRILTTPFEPLRCRRGWR